MRSPGRASWIAKGPPELASPIDRPCISRCFNRRVRYPLFGLLLLATAISCRNESTKTDAERSVTVYFSVDTAFAEPILRDFEKKSGIKVNFVPDTEAGKTTGLVNRIRHEKDRPRADVWWSSEIFATISLADDGLLAEYRSPAAPDIPEQYRDAKGRWTAYALRGRVLAYDPKRTKPEDLPRRWVDVADPKYKNRFRMADPRFGTTRGHMAALLTLWGPEAMTDFYKRLKANGCHLTAGNSQSVALLVRGEADVVATDTDDVIVAQARGDSIEMAYPDLAGGGMAAALGGHASGSASGSAGASPSQAGAAVSTAGEGAGRYDGTLWIPCTVAVVAGAPHVDEARRLADYLISAEVEEALARSESRNVPVRAALCEKLGIQAIRAARVDYAAVAAKLAESDRLINDVLLK